jgi:hypothetical protein
MEKILGTLFLRKDKILSKFKVIWFKNVNRIRKGILRQDKKKKKRLHHN